MIYNVNFPTPFIATKHKTLVIFCLYKFNKKLNLSAKPKRTNEFFRDHYF